MWCPHSLQGSPHQLRSHKSTENTKHCPCVLFRALSSLSDPQNNFRTGDPQRRFLSRILYRAVLANAMDRSRCETNMMMHSQRVPHEELRLTQRRRAHIQPCSCSAYFNSPFTRVTAFHNKEEISCPLQCFTASSSTYPFEKFRDLFVVSCVCWCTSKCTYLNAYIQTMHACIHTVRKDTCVDVCWG
jgi:hypothetical protein